GAGSRKLSVERLLPRFGSAGEPLSYSLVFRNRSRTAQKSLIALDELTDPRPSFTQFASTPEPGEEKRNWFDRLYNYYRWNWLIAQNTRAQIGEQLIPDLPLNSSRAV